MRLELFCRQISNDNTGLSGCLDLVEEVKKNQQADTAGEDHDSLWQIREESYDCQCDEDQSCNDEQDHPIRPIFMNQI